MDESILYTLIDSDFEILNIEDGEKKHFLNKHATWGVEAVLKRNLTKYYYFEVNQQNLEKNVVPGDAYVNGVKAMKVSERGQYIILKEEVSQPLEIHIENIEALRVYFLNLRNNDYLYLAHEKATISIFDYHINEYNNGRFKPKFTAFKHNTKEIVTLEEFEYYHNPTHPYLYFKMPPYDIDILVEKEEDDQKCKLIIDESGIKDIEYSLKENYNINCAGIVSEAIYSDDYDFGVEDHYFYERAITFKKGTRLKVVIYLLEERNVICSLNGIDYEPFRMSKEEVRDNDGKITLTYEYTFKPLEFKDEGVLSFRIK